MNKGMITDNDKRIAIYIVGHKPFSIPKECDAIYIPILVGGAVTYGEENGFLTDNTGSNISEKNANYCELTAYYWIWKNDTANEIVGISHYRRYFTEKGKILSALDIEQGIVGKKNNGVILPKPIIWKKDSVYLAYLRGAGYKKDIENMIKIIREDHPEYVPALFQVLSGKKASYCNMVICRKSFFNEYCEWLFGILEKVEKLTDMTGYTASERRIYGYLGEILLNVFCRKNECAKEEKPLLMLEESNIPHIKKKKAELGKGIKKIVKYIIWFPSGIKPARRKMMK